MSIFITLKTVPCLYNFCNLFIPKQSYRYIFKSSNSQIIKSLSLPQ